MRDFAILFIQLIVAVFKLMRPSRGRAVVSEFLLLKPPFKELPTDKADTDLTAEKIIAGLENYEADIFPDETGQ